MWLLGCAGSPQSGTIKVNIAGTLGFTPNPTTAPPWRLAVVYSLNPAATASSKNIVTVSSEYLSRS